MSKNSILSRIFPALIIVMISLLLSACEENKILIQHNQSKISKENLSPQPDNKTINYCRDYCSYVQGGENDKVEYNKTSNRFYCTCSDYQYELAVKTEIAPRDLNLYAHKKIWWDDLPIPYQIMNKDDCGDYEIRQIHQAFERIENDTKVVQFEEVGHNASLELTCTFLEDCYQKKIDIRKEEGVIYEYESICPHVAGIAQITKLEGFKIRKAKITLIGLAGFAETNGYGASGFYVGSCGYPTVEIHEILHTFGFGHSNRSESMMYDQTELVPYTIQKEGACVGSNKQIDQEIIDDLMFVYG
jgi:hypothetical protein